MTFSKAIAFFMLFVQLCLADIYLHNPRGSNDRLSAQTPQRQNANRLFDSQNNAKGGYNVGEATSSRATTEGEFYRMVYFMSGSAAQEGTYLPIEYSVQHGCGNNEVFCQVIIQLMCQPDEPINDATEWQIRDGSTESTVQFTKPPNSGETEVDRQQRKVDDSESTNEGVNEPWEWYNECYQRERNIHLFTADRKLRKVSVDGSWYSSAIHTRQNNNGKRYGYECPEEKDYYPYFSPTPWKDIAILTDSHSRNMCSYYLENSFSGTRAKGVCAAQNGDRIQAAYRFNNASACEENEEMAWFEVYNFLEKLPEKTTEAACLEADGDVRPHKTLWAAPWDAENVNEKQCLVQVPDPECGEAPWARPNHHGNEKITGEFPRFNWRIPFFPSGNNQRCVLRARYNITSFDFDPMSTDASSNKEQIGDIERYYIRLYNKKRAEIRRMRNMTSDEKVEAIEELHDRLMAEANERIENNYSPVENDLEISIAPGFPDVQFATNTDQIGRVFQDRTHVFRLIPRPAAAASRSIYNINVKGKRGNIVQVYPAVEYDFVPRDLEIPRGSLVHIQWTGSNHVIGDGEGQQGTDRNNMVQVESAGVNYPLVFPEDTLAMWANAKVLWTPFDNIELFPFLSGRTARRMSIPDKALEESDYHRMDSEFHLLNRNGDDAVVLSLENQKLTSLNSRGSRVGQFDDFEHNRRISQMRRVNSDNLIDNDNVDEREMHAENWSWNDESTVGRVSSNRGNRRSNRRSNTGRRRTLRLSRSLGKIIGNDGFTNENLALAMLTSGRFWCLANGNCPPQIPGGLVAPEEITEDVLNPTIDQATPTFPGVLLEFSPGTYRFICSRNNNFSNRQQKGQLVVR